MKKSLDFSKLAGLTKSSKYKELTYESPEELVSLKNGENKILLRA
jgi:hypothetical protein